MRRLLHRLALVIFRRLPTGVRRRIVRTVSPSYTVGAMCFIERGDGAVLLVRHSYRARWGVPGGLLKKGEAVDDGARREVREEVGLDIDLVGVPVVVVDAPPQRVDVIFRCRLRDPADAERVAPRSPEIVEVRWFGPHELPELQFESAGALATLRRRDTERLDPALPAPRWPQLDR